MTTESLRDDLTAIPGVASAEVTIKQDETPIARVWLDGTRDGTEVRELVGALLGQGAPDLAEATDDAPRRRVGLGRGLGDLLPEDDSHPVPSQLQPDAINRPSVATVSVVESSSGVFVTVTDNKDREASVSVDGHNGIDAAVISAVGKLFGIDDSIQVSVNDLDVATGSVLVASVSDDVARSAGAAFVEFGRPSAVARAVFQAIAGMP